MQRYDIINKFIELRGYKSYLELGIQNPIQCFDRIVCDLKHGVDPDPNAQATYPMTSDAFFASNKATYSIIFIDALHLSEAVERDCQNALKCLNPGGVVIFHDCRPVLEVEQLREMNNMAWCGDVWRAWVNLRRQCGYLSYTLSMDWGCGIIDSSRKAAIYPPFPEDILTWKWFCQNKWALGLTDKIK